MVASHSANGQVIGEVPQIVLLENMFALLTHFPIFRFHNGSELILFEMFRNLTKNDAIDAFTWSTIAAPCPRWAAKPEDAVQMQSSNFLNIRQSWQNKII